MTFTREDIIGFTPTQTATDHIAGFLRSALAAVESGKFAIQAYDSKSDTWRPYSWSPRAVERARTERVEIVAGFGPVSMFEIRIVHTSERTDAEMAADFGGHDTGPSAEPAVGVQEEP